MVELFAHDLQESGHRSSKGNQLKWRNKEDWYKADYTGYEGLAEYMISHLLEKSTLRSEEFVVYRPVQIRYGKVIYNGAQSRHFLTEDWQIITLERLFKNYFGESLSEIVYRIEDHTERLRFIVGQVERITGLSGFGIYMNKLLTIDAFFLNEDRHTHNIAVLMNAKGEFSYCPFFDHGAGLLADTTMDYPVNEEVCEMMKMPKAKTVCREFDEQLDISEELYGGNLKFSFTKRDVEKLLAQEDIYAPEIKQRVRDVLFLQMEKYQYLFQNNPIKREEAR